MIKVIIVAFIWGVVTSVLMYILTKIWVTSHDQFNLYKIPKSVTDAADWLVIAGFGIGVMGARLVLGAMIWVSDHKHFIR